MRSHAAAFAWEFRRRHLWGLIAVTGYILALAAFRLVMLARGQPVALDDEQTFAFAVIVPSGSAFTYFLGAFSFGFAGNLAGRQSIYPARLFTLPVTTGALAGWPMLFGAAAMAIFWTATRLFAMWPSSFEAPVIWPAVLAVVFLAWVQALTWMPYGLPGLRVLVTMVLLVLLAVVVIAALHLEATEPVMLAILVPQLPLAFVVARSAVARARRGDTPDWPGFFARHDRLADVLPSHRDRFLSPARAQAWFEWRRFGRSLPAMVGMVLPFELVLLFMFPYAEGIVFQTLAAVLLTPPILAVFVAATARTPNLDGGDAYGLTPFIATRPLATADLVTAKLKTTISSALATWLLVLVTLSLGLRFSGASPVVVAWMQKLIEAIGTPRAVAIVVLTISAVIASTWKLLVLSLTIGLSGRQWLVKGSVFFVLSLLAVIVPFAQWAVSRQRLMLLLWNALPWIAAFLVVVKMAAAAWFLVRLAERRLLSDRKLVLGAAAWTVTVMALYGLLVWLVPTILIPRFFLALVAILATPLARLAAAPLALSWNRHR